MQHASDGLSGTGLLRGGDASAGIGHCLCSGYEAFFVSPHGSPSALKTEKRRNFPWRPDNGLGHDDHQRPDDSGRGRDLDLGWPPKRLYLPAVFPALCIDLYDLQSLRHGFL